MMCKTLKPYWRCGCLRFAMLHVLSKTSHAPSDAEVSIVASLLMNSRLMLLCTCAGPTGKVLLLPEDPNAVIIMVATGTGKPGHLSKYLEAHILENLRGASLWMCTSVLTPGQG